MVVGYMTLLLSVQSMHITTNVVSSNIAHGDVYSMQHYMIKFVSDLQQVGGFLRVLRFPPPINGPSRYRCNIVESGIKHYNLNPVLTRSIVHQVLVYSI